ncbi:UvrB/UvrC motif-containing protein [Paludicola sp. MB14-C6]|uniref:UvrB/UvrC motif-containing protein n=1 Tax=Paludihabitans sp. MB14-C6 TaxID=3070656 RepID=UPI0027DC513D|nr:UvrB/UvrC motif-containing protein [Paludicola sp. MB14-C6]WMJ23100.1 UvrB/UvrC motif-containing protein [Paludicola sp. MB14-C6]
MLCEKCKQNIATSIVTKTVNGMTTTIHMCGECAFKAGYSNLFGNFSLNHFMADLEQKANKKLKICPKCGSDFAEILSNGKLGCSQCYTEFRNELLPSIENIHGKAYHVGKKPARYREAQSEANLMDELKQKLNDAIEKQEFEAAAVLRDEIKKMQSEE